MNQYDIPANFSDTELKSLAIKGALQAQETIRHYGNDDSTPLCPSPSCYGCVFRVEIVPNKSCLDTSQRALDSVNCISFNDLISKLEHYKQKNPEYFI